ncbi:MAG: hypothetical protein WC477_06315 [Patescibacteria group bacterium]
MAETNILGDLLVKLRGDLTELEKSLKLAQGDSDKTGKEIEKNWKKSFDKIGSEAQKVGKSLSTFITLPFVAAATGFVLAADNQAQAEAALANAIKATGKETSISVKNLSAYATELQNATLFGDEAQLSALALVQQLANLDENGLKAVLPGILDFSTAMGVDLKTAASLVGKTLGSETNALSRYGIQVDASATQTEKLAQLTDQLQKKFSGAASTAASVGIGSLKQLANQAGDLAEEFGLILLPSVDGISKGLSSLTTSLQGLDKTTKTNILVVGGFAAALGPAIAGVGAITKAMAEFNLSLLTNPIVAVTTALVALGATAVIVNNNIKSLQEEKKVLDKLLAGGTTGSYVKDLELVNKEIESVNAQIAGSTGFFEEENAELQAQLSILQKARTEIAMKAQGQRAVNDGKKIETLTEEQIIELAKRRAKLEEQYKDSRKEVLAILESEKSEYKKLQEQIESLEKTPWASGKLESERIAALEALHARQNEIVAEAEQRLSEEEKANLEVIGNVARAKAEAERENLARLDREAKAAKDAQEKVKQAYIESGKFIISTLQGMFSQIQSLYNQDAQNKIDAINYSLNSDLQAIDKRMQAELEAAGLSEKTTIEELQKKLDAAIAQGDLVTAEEIRQEIARAEIKDKYEKQKEEREKKAALAIYKVQLEQFKVNQKLSRTQAVIDTASAALKTATSVPWPFNLPLIAAMVALGAKQIDIINDQVPPSPPALAKGGEIGANNPTLAVIGDNTRYNEVVAPLSPDTFAKIAEGILVALASRARPSGVTENTAGASTMYGSGSSSGSSMTVNAGIIVANDAGLRAFARVITPYLHEESVRIG